MKLFDKSPGTLVKNHKNWLSATLSKNKAPAAVVFVVLFAAIGTIILGFGRATTTVACSGLDRTYGAAEMNVDVPQDGTYRVWSRVMAPDSENNSYYLSVGGDECNAIGDAAIPSGEWTWVDYKNNDAADKNDMSLSAGTQQVQMIGREPDVKLDRVILSSDLECVPTGTGDNCADVDTDEGNEEPQGNVLLNTDFDSYTGGEADSWTFMADGVTVYEASEHTYTEGSAQLVQITDNPGWGLVMYQTPEGFPTGNYEVHLVYKADAEIRVEVGNRNFTEKSFAQTMPATNGEWVAETLSFTHENTNATDIRISHPNTGTFLVDHYGLYAEDEAPVLPDTPDVGGDDTAPDTTDPIVSLTSPAEGDTVSDNTTVSANASDDTSVVHVEFAVNGSVVNTASTSPYDFDWNTASVSDGSHTVTAQAFDEAGNSASDQISVLVDNADSQAPTAPDNLSAEVVAVNQVDLSWDVASDNVGIEHYNVYRDDTLIARTDTIGYSDTTVREDTTYSYHVTAEDAVGNESDPSETVTATTPQQEDTQAPTAPSNLSANATETNKVDLTWGASSDDTGVDGYYIYRDDAVISATNADTTSFSETRVTAGTTYEYYIRAFDAAGNFSAKSNMASVTTPTSGDADTEAPSVPANLQASSSNKHQVDLTWEISSDDTAVSRYDVFRDGSHLGSTSSTSFGDGTVNPNKTYEYTVRSVDTSGNESDFSNPATATVLPPGRRK